MALSMTKTVMVAGTSVSFDSAYVRVESVHGTKNEMSAYVEFRTQDKQHIIGSESIQFAHDCNVPDNVIRQAYLHLKTLPEFANATDC